MRLRCPGCKAWCTEADLIGEIALDASYVIVHKRGNVTFGKGDAYTSVCKSCCRELRRGGSVKVSKRIDCKREGCKECNT